MNYSLYRAFLEKEIESYISRPYQQQHAVQVKELTNENLLVFLNSKLITPREREAIELRFSEEAVMPYSKVGKILGVTMGRARQLVREGSIKIFRPTAGFIVRK